MKVETHNHPTAISPFPGAATGSGGEIRDEGATGRGAKPKAGLVGFTVSHLERARLAPAVGARVAGQARPDRVAAVDHARRPDRRGELQQRVRPAESWRAISARACSRRDGVWRGYHKPIMIAGGLGNVRAANVEKGVPGPGAKLVVLGGPAMLIGLGGGAASSQGSGAGEAELDFASVQRGNAEMQRRAQEVIDTLLGARRRQSDRRDPRHRRGRALERRARDRRAQQLRRRDRAARDPERRARHEPHGDLVQRSARALHADGRGRRSSRGSLPSASASAARMP